MESSYGSSRSYRATDGETVLQAAILAPSDCWRAFTVNSLAEPTGVRSHHGALMWTLRILLPNPLGMTRDVWNQESVKCMDEILT